MSDDEVQETRQVRTDGRKKKIRGGHRAHLKKLLAEIGDLLRGYSLDREEELLAVKGCLERKAKVISKLDEEILEEMDDEIEIADEIENSENIQTEIHRDILRIEKVIKKHKDEAEQREAVSSSAPVREVSERNTVTIGLPKLDIPRFSGDPKEYQSFIECFDAAMGMYNISDVQKFTYLKRHLVGEAEKVVRGLALTDANYQEARDALKSRFGNKQVIINSHMESLISLPTVTSNVDTKKIRDLYDKVETNLRSLRNLGIEPEMYGSLLVPIMKSKLPHELNLILSRKFDEASEVWKIKDMMEELRIELEARERVGEQRKTRDSNSEGNSRDKSTTGSLFVEQRKVCAYCKRPHYSDRCRTVTDIAARKKLLKEENRCYVCTGTGHLAKDCTYKKTCFRCKGRHHTSICTKDEKDSRQNNTDHNQQDGVVTNQSVVNLTSADKEETILLQTATVNAMNSTTSRSEKCRILLDTGSQRSYITTRLARQLQLKELATETLQINTFGSSSEPKEYKVVEVTLKSIRANRKIKIAAIEVPRICSEIAGQHIPLVKEMYPELRNLEFADEGLKEAQLEVEILVGLDLYWEVVCKRFVKLRKGTVALETIFGYVLSGPLKVERTINTDQPTSTFFIDVQCSKPESLEDTLHKFWSLESIGINEKDTVEERFLRSIDFKDGRYEVRLPWKDSHPLLCDNYVLAERRLNQQLKKLRKQPELLSAYADVMKEQLNNNVIEIPPERQSPTGKTYYMPHQAVIRNDHTTTKVRVVYDASSKMFGPSLNECIEAGDSRFLDLFGVLLRFRCYRFVVVADIEKAFLNIGIADEDRDALRLLWVDNPFDEKSEIKVMRFTRVCFGLVSSMFHLEATIDYHLKNYNNLFNKNIAVAVINRIRESLYADDFSSGASNIEEATMLYQNAKKIFSDASMNLRKWQSNSSAMEAIMEKNKHNKNDMVNNERSYADESLNCAQKSELKILGIPWNKREDKFKFSIHHLISNLDPDIVTKRRLLQFSASIFDPLGLLAPATLPLKLIFQEVCNDGKGWDEKMEEAETLEFRKWVRDAERVDEIVVDRWNGVGFEGSIVSLIGFCDASEKGYAACIYLRVGHTDKPASSTLIVSKTKVKPLIKQTIPRLELLSALLLARLMKCVRQNISTVADIQQVFYLSDSKVAIHWIKNTKRQYKQFVENRVQEIRQKTNTKDWYHVGSKNNIADLASRGCTLKELNSKPGWFNGPKWLEEEFSGWPISVPEHAESLKEAEIETKRETVINIAADNKCKDVSPTIQLEEVFDLTRFSTFQRLIKVTLLVLRFIRRCRKVVQDETTDTSLSEESRKLWYRYLQSFILRDRQHFKKIQESLGLFKDEEGLYRCGGRLKKANLMYSSKHPVLIPSDHQVTHLIILEAHEKVYHNGLAETLSEVRSRFWLIRGRQVVKKVIRGCLLCRKVEGMSYPSPTTAVLPTCRVNEGRPFQFTGIDFCGPVYLKSEKKMKKAYIALMTCAITRLVHLELVPDLSSTTLIRCLRRFIARRGIPTGFISDNAKTFKSRELKSFITKNEIQWRFNIPRAPWWGGLFERLIRSTKRCLRKTARNIRATYEEFLTILTEIEGVLNSRPLTYVGSDELIESLTPSHLCYGYRLLTPAATSDFDENEIVITRKDAVKRQRRIQQTVNHFWKRWQKEYLLELRERSYCQRKSRQVDVQEGDIVHVYEENQKRNKWRLGQVEKVIRTSDGEVRGAEVRVIEKNKKPLTISRPIQKLYPLEMKEDKRRSASSDGKEGHNENINNNENDHQKKRTDVDASNAECDVSKRKSDSRDESPRSLEVTPGGIGGSEPMVNQLNGINHRIRRAAAVDSEWRRRLVDNINNDDDELVGLGPTGENVETYYFLKDKMKFLCKQNNRNQVTIELY